uniref:Uncharacterized protein n=1 Tax=Arundo donax TaxID=35708 RepID=A0A0A9DWI9_ARUDO
MDTTITNDPQTTVTRSERKFPTSANQRCNPSKQPEICSVRSEITTKRSDR